MKTAYLIHGFNVSDGGKGTVDKFEPLLRKRGYHVVQLDYGWTGRIGVRICNSKLARFLAATADPESLIICHSNGAAIAMQSTWFGAKFSQMVLINPALDNNVRCGPYVDDIHVWHSPSDIPVKLAKFIPGSLWGDMGAVGYRGEDFRFINYDKENDFEISSNGHSDIFKNNKFEYFAPLILNEVERKYVELAGDI